MDLKEQFGVDSELAQTGVWVSVDGNGTRLHVAAMPNPAFEKYLAPHYRRFRSLGEDVPEGIYEEAIAKTVLLGWEGIDHDGKALAADGANRLAMLRQYPRFKSMVIAHATNVKNFQRQADEAELKN